MRAYGKIESNGFTNIAKTIKAISTLDTNGMSWEINEVSKKDDTWGIYQSDIATTGHAIICITFLFIGA